jgi:hypothetical protein
VNEKEQREEIDIQFNTKARELATGEIVRIYYKEFERLRKDICKRLKGGFKWENAGK